MLAGIVLILHEEWEPTAARELLRRSRMYRTAEVDTPAQWERFRALGGITAEETDMFPRGRADACWLLESASGRPSARCGLWWNATAQVAGQPTGIVGHYHAEDAAAGAQMLEFACNRLQRQGCRLAIGPMDGSTWRRYRLVTDRVIDGQESQPPFFLEPDNPDDWPQHFLAAGFAPIARYHSALGTNLSIRFPGADAAASRFEAEGGTLRALRMGQFEEELRRMYALSGESFRNSPFFTALAWEEFQTMYSKLRDRVRPELVLLAERAGKLMGLLFAIPDLLQAARQRNIDTVIIKSLAVHPDFARAGLGTLLGDRCHQIAYESGFRRVIHALMSDGNYSDHISRHVASAFRRYALFGKDLARVAV
jgi:GNAT superfamily N-acetyltransferase